MGLPLQADLNPAPYWYRRFTLLIIAFISVMLLGWCHFDSTKQVHYLNNENSQFLKTLSTRIESAQQRIWCMHYVIRLGDKSDDPKHPVNFICKLLIAAKQRGVDVRLVVDESDPEATYPGPDNTPVIQLMQKHKIPIFTDERERTSHAKIFLIDDVAIVGSHNLTSWALTKNRESSILTNDVSIIQEIEQEFAGLFQ